MSYHNPSAGHFGVQHYLRGRTLSGGLVAARDGGRAYADGGMFLSARRGMGGVPHLIAAELGGTGNVVMDSIIAARKKEESEDDRKKNKKRFQDNSQAEYNRVSKQKFSLKKPTTVKRSDGKVKVETNSFWSDWNKTASVLTKPLAGPLKAAGISASRVQEITERPLDAFLDVFDPVEDRIGAAVDRVMAKKGYTQNYFGKNINLRRVQGVDRKGDKSTRNFMKRLRTVQAFIVLMFTQPGQLAIEMAFEGFDLVGDIAKAVGNMIKSAGEAAGEAAGNVAKGVENGVKSVVSFFVGGVGLGHYSGNYSGYYTGIGEPVEIAAGAGVAGETAAYGITIEEVLKQAIPILTKAIIDGAFGVASDAIKGGGKKDAGSGEKSEGSAYSTGQETSSTDDDDDDRDDKYDQDDEQQSSGVSPGLLFGGAAALVAVLMLLRK